MNDFIETDAKKIYDRIITGVEGSVGESLYPGDERRIFVDAIAAVFVSLFNQMNDAAKQKMLQYARGDVLDALGERVGVERFAATPAETTLRFSVDAAFGQNIIIPQGTRATGDSTRFFETTENAVIEAGELYVDVPARSVGAGVDYNDIAVGTINTIVDPVPYVDSVQNTTVTAGGTDTENDDSLRDRIRTAPSTLSTAGPIRIVLRILGEDGGCVHCRRRRIQPADDVDANADCDGREGVQGREQTGAGDAGRLSVRRNDEGAERYRLYGGICG